MFTGLLNKTVTVSRKINAGDNVAPNYIEVPVVSLSMVYDQLSANKVLKDGNNKIVADYKFYSDHDYSVKEDDYLTVDMERFHVYRVYNPNQLNHHLEIFALRVDNTVGAS